MLEKPWIDLKPGDRVRVARRLSRVRKSVRRGTVISVGPRHVLVDLGRYRESFSFEDVELIHADGRIEPVVRRLSKEVVDRVLDARRGLNHDFRAIDEAADAVFSEDERPPEWLELRRREDKGLGIEIDPQKLEEFVRRYNAGERTAVIMREMGINGVMFSAYLRRARENGLVTTRAAVKPDATAAAEKPEPRAEAPEASKEPSTEAAEAEVSDKGVYRERTAIESNVGAEELRQLVREAIERAKPDSWSSGGQVVMFQGDAYQPFDLASMSDNSLRTLYALIREEAARRFLGRV